METNPHTSTIPRHNNKYQNPHSHTKVTNKGLSNQVHHTHAAKQNGPYR